MTKVTVETTGYVKHHRRSGYYDWHDGLEVTPVTDGLCSSKIPLDWVEGDKIEITMTFEKRPPGTLY